MILTHVLLFDQSIIFMPPYLIFFPQMAIWKLSSEICNVAVTFETGKIVFLAFEKLQQLKTCIFSYKQLEMKHLT